MNQQGSKPPRGKKDQGPKKVEVIRRMADIAGQELVAGTPQKRTGLHKELHNAGERGHLGNREIGGEYGRRLSSSPITERITH